LQPFDVANAARGVSDQRVVYRGTCLGGQGIEFVGGFIGEDDCLRAIILLFYR
jgi:hypothetical protein